MKRVVVALLFVPFVLAPSASAKTARPDHVVIFSIPGVTWEDLLGNCRALREFCRPGNAIGDLSARTASRTADIARSYLTLGAGDPAYALSPDPNVNLAFGSNDPYENGSAQSAQLRRTGVGEPAAIVAPGIEQLQALQHTRNYGAFVGALGETLDRAHIRTAVVSAADLAIHPTVDQMRRSAVLSLVDKHGYVDYGKLDDLLVPDARAPFGVRTNDAAFLTATRDALKQAQVVVLDPGDTSRANEYVQYVAKGFVTSTRQTALAETALLFRDVKKMLGPRDTLFVLAPSGPTPPVFREHLAPIAASGFGYRTQRSWLTSATTRRDGMLVLSDIAPTILHAFGVPQPDTMVGTPIYDHGSNASIRPLIELDHASSIREHFASAAFWVIASLISVLAILAFVVFLGRREPFYKPLVALAYFGLAFFPAAHIIRAMHYWRFGITGAHLVLYTIAAAIAVAAWFLPGPRWAGAVALMLLTAGLFASDIATGGPLQLNGVFGHSPLVAGRFYGVSNPGYAILFSSALLGFTGLAELRGQSKIPWWTVLLLVAIIPIDGLPMSGADLGGLLAGIPAVAVTIALGRRWRIRWRTIVAFAVAALVGALGLSFLDLLRPPQERTHLGRFAATIASGDVSKLETIIHRKAIAALTSLTVTRWTWFIPVGFAVLVLLLIRPRGILRTVLARRPILRAGLWGTLVAGALGFAVNDSGISIPALALAFVVPYFVLLAVDTEKPRNATVP
jgi:hypothetical protein